MAGEIIFVDYGGQTVPLVDAETGTEREIQIFAGVLGANNFTFPDATSFLGSANSLRFSC